MTATTVPEPASALTLSPVRKPSSAARVAFRALLLRDLVVLRKTLKEFIPRTVLQPFLLVFVFTYVFPKIGQGVGGTAQRVRVLHPARRRRRRTGDHVPGDPVGRAADGAGVRVHPRDRGPRAGAACRSRSVAIQKAIWGALTGLFSALLVFPIAAIVPATPVSLDINWPVLITLIPLACYMCGALGLTFGTRFEPRTVPLLFGIIVIPLTFLGCVYYSWSSLAPIRWLQVFVLLNPLVYMCEGFRAALTTAPHMSLWAVYGALIGFSALFTWLGINGFKKRVLS